LPARSSGHTDTFAISNASSIETSTTKETMNTGAASASPIRVSIDRACAGLFAPGRGPV
jgi:hypothetical protein